MEKQKYILKAIQGGKVIYNNTFNNRESYEIAKHALEELDSMNDGTVEPIEIISSEDEKENISEGAINFSKDNSKYPTLVFDPNDLIEDYSDEVDIENANDVIREVYGEIKERFQLGSNQEVEDAQNYANIKDVDLYLGVPNTSSELACIELKFGYYEGFQLSIVTPRLEDLTSSIRDGYTSYDEEMPDADIKNMLDEAEKNAVEFLKKLHLEYPDSKFLHKAGWVPSYSDNFEEACDSKTSGKMLKEETGPWYDYGDGSMICQNIADDLENGNTFGSLSDSQGSHLTNWKATINGKDVEDVVFSTAVIDWVLRELSYPVADGHIYYRDLNLIFNNYSYSDDIDIYNEQVQQDLIALGFDEDKVKEMAEKDIPEDGSINNPDLEEIECWIDYDIEFYNGCDNMDDVVEKYKESMGIDEAKDESVRIQKYYVYAGYYENIISCHELHKPFVLRDTFDTFEDAYNYVEDNYTDDNLLFTKDTIDDAISFGCVLEDDAERYMIDEAKEMSDDESVSDYPELKGKVKDWYKAAFPEEDFIYNDMDPDVTFEDIYNNPRQVYDLLKVGDSVARENVFRRISEIKNIKYDDIYYRWLGREDKKSQKINESADDVLKDTVKDWYKETYPTDDYFGDRISDTVTFEEIAKQPSRVYDLLNVTDSLVRERVFQEISSRGKIPYDDIYKNWLGESKQIDSMKLLKKNLQKINESFDSMNVSEKTSEKKIEVKAKEDTKVFSDKNDTYSIKVKKNNKQEIEEALKILDNAFDKKD